MAPAKEFAGEQHPRSSRGRGFGYLKVAGPIFSTYKYSAIYGRTALQAAVEQGRLVGQLFAVGLSCLKVDKRYIGGRARKLVMVKY